MNNFYFSAMGLIFLIMLMIPNLIWNQLKPADYELYVQNENKILLFLERFGQVSVTCCSLFYYESSFNSTWILWLALLLMSLYEIHWIRYFLSKRTMKDFYRSLFKIPVAGATLPVIAFLLLGVYVKNGFLIISVIILGIGHIQIHLNHRKEIN